MCGALEGLGGDVSGADRVAYGQAEGAGEVVAGADGDDAERGRGAGDGLEGEVDHAVAADGDERPGPVLDGLAGPAQRVLGVLAEDGAHGESGGPQRGSGRLRGVRAPAASRGGIDEEGDLAGHPPDLTRSGGPVKVR